MNAITPVSFSKGRAYEPRLSTPYVPGRRAERYWNEIEKDIVRQYYPDGGLAACQAHLPGRSRSGIQGMAHTLGVASNWQHKPRVKLIIPDGIDERIRAEWPLLKGRGAVNALADKLQVERWWLSKRALKLELAMPYKKEPPWTEAELAMLKKVPLHDPHKAAQIFHQHGYSRTPAAIMVKAKRLNISRRYNCGLSGTAFARILGIDNKTTTSWCIAGDLKASRRGTLRRPQQGGDVWEISRADARRFILANLERIDIRKVEKFAFIDLLTGSTASKGENLGEMG